MSKRDDPCRDLSGSYHDNCMTDKLVCLIDDSVELDRLNALHLLADKNHELFTQPELNKMLVTAIRMRMGWPCDGPT